MLNKIFKLFFVFIFILVGFLFLTVRNYIMPEVNITKVQDNSVLVKKYYFSGKVKPRNIIEVKADEKNNMLCLCFNYYNRLYDYIFS